MRRPAVAVVTGLLAIALAVTGTSSAVPVAGPIINTVAPAPALRLVSFAPVADSTTEAGSTTPQGMAPFVTADASPMRVAYLRFDTTSLQGEFARAVIRLHVADDPSGSLGSGSDSGGTVAAVSNHAWSEAELLDVNRPPVDGLRLDAVDAVAPGSWVQFDVSRALRRGAILDVALTTKSGDGVRYDSREAAATAPQLVVSVGQVSPPANGIVLATVGDMACAPGAPATPTSCDQRAVSDLIIQDPPVQAFLALGDLQYPAGSLADFASYDRSYGRLNDLVAPVIGNHEYLTPNAAGYFEYFRAAGVPARLQLGGPNDAYYSFDLGPAWHVVVLNSNCAIVSCSAGSAQERWLRADLSSSTRPCTIVAWHHPRFASSSVHASNTAVAPLWQAAQDAGVEISLAGHNHHYERFEPQRNDGSPSPNAPRAFVVGTGGVGLYTFAEPLPTSDVRIAEFGYLRFNLRVDGYDWQFVGEHRAILDSGSGTCQTA